MKLIKFYTDSCQPCEVMKPIIEELVENHPEIDYEEVNCSQGVPDEWAQEIRSVPTIIIIRDGQPNEKIVGTRTYNYLENLICSNP